MSTSSSPPLTKLQLEVEYRRKQPGGTSIIKSSHSPDMDPDPRALLPPTPDEVAALKAFVDSGGLHRSVALQSPMNTVILLSPSPSPPPPSASVMQRAVTAPLLSADKQQ